VQNQQQGLGWPPNHPIRELKSPPPGTPFQVMKLDSAWGGLSSCIKRTLGELHGELLGRLQNHQKPPNHIAIIFEDMY